MADLVDHINQAKHNLSCANYLLQNPALYADWAITATFYAAVHYIEAAFTTQPEIGHTESAPDRHDLEQHAYRIEKLRELVHPAAASYEKLYRASRAVRYLKMAVSSGDNQATSYYSLPTIRDFVDRQLVIVRTELEKAFGVNLS